MTDDPLVPQLIDCIDCGGRCHLQVTWAPDDPPQPGDVIRYRCEDCRDEWFLVVPGEDEDGRGDGPWT